VVAGLLPRDAPIAAFVERCLNETVKYGTITHSPYRLELWVIWTARKAYQAGKLDAMMELSTATEVAELLGVHRTTVFRWAREYELGWRIGRDVLLGGDDVERMRRLVRK